MNTYRETLDYLYNSLPTYHRIGDIAYKPTLENTLALSNHLGNPHTKFKALHIAGTNGKGSTSHMLAAILQLCGYKTGLYTSPHLKNFTERIKVNGVEMDPQKVVDFVQNYKVHFESIKPSFFEMTTVLAFDHFAKEKVDVAVVEVGLGGRLDSTNIIHPLLSVITNISLDHQNILGDTLVKIAGEKAGIVKANVPLIVSQYQEEVYPVFDQKIKELSSKVVVASEKYHLQNVKLEYGKLSGDLYQGSELRMEDLIMDLPGMYQVHNIPGVFASIDILREQGFILPEEKIKQALSQVVALTGLKGRWQILNKNPLTICDTAHNEAGIRYVVDQLRSLTYQQLHIVFGAVNDKDVNKVLSLLPKDAYYYFCQPDIPRALDAHILFSAAQNFQLEGEVIPKVSRAIAKAKLNSTPEDVIFIGGSNFVVAEADI